MATGLSLQIIRITGDGGRTGKEACYICAAKQTMDLAEQDWRPTMQNRACTPTVVLTSLHDVLSPVLDGW
jgi:hypothetical protein